MTEYFVTVQSNATKKQETNDILGTKAELLLLKLTPIICLVNFINKKVEIEKTKPN